MQKFPLHMGPPTAFKKVISTGAPNTRNLASVASAIVVAGFFMFQFSRMDGGATQSVANDQAHSDCGRQRLTSSSAVNSILNDAQLLPVRNTRVPDVLMKEGRQHNPSDIKQIALLGERNSGTTWMTAHLRECFEHALPVKVTLVRHKHWFQHDILPDRRVKDTLVVSEFRNPCQWAEAMRVKNYVAPMHHKVKDWETFVTTPWTMPRLDHDLELVRQYREEHGGVLNASDIPCQKDFTYNQINACVHVPYVVGELLKKRAEKRVQKNLQKGKEDDGFSGQEPFYENMNDGSGRPYNTLMAMRSDKIKNFLEVYQWDWVAAVLPIQYEEMVRLGTKSLIQNVERLTGVKAQCTPSPPQDRAPREIPKEMVDWMMKYVDWETEALVGYDKC